MKNENPFYTDYDCTRIQLPEESFAPEDYRSPFQIDRDRILFSSSFRRLQGKTQIYSVGEYDFYRTRLTHSIEVAKIGRSICNHLNRQHKEDSLLNKGSIDPALVEAAGLAHDIGHPPFGHAGEEALNTAMKEYGGFEGNAQSLRIVTSLIFEEYEGLNQHKGMNGTRAFLDSLLKYKKIFSNQIKEKKFLYENQYEILKYILNGFDIDLMQDGKQQSIECQIMEWADNTAYSIHDVADGVKSGFLTKGKIREWVKKRLNKESLNTETRTQLEKLESENKIDWIVNQRQAFVRKEIRRFIKACSLEEDGTFHNNNTFRYSCKLKIDTEFKELYQIYKKLAIDLVYSQPEIKQSDYKFKRMTEDLFKILMEKPKETLSPKIQEEIKHKSDREKARSICDYIAGMTDSFAIHTYKRLTDPSYGSFRDII